MRLCDWSNPRRFRAGFIFSMQRQAGDETNPHRSRRSQRRPEAWRRCFAELSLDDVDPGSEGQNIDLLALDEAMKKLEEQSPRQHQVVMLRFFAGLKDAEIAEMLGVADKTVRRDWATARVWLYSEMSK